MVKGTRMPEFPYGEIFPPQYMNLFDQVLLGELGPSQMCITEDVLRNLAQYRPRIPRLGWESNEYSSCSGGSRHRRTVLCVVRRRHGWHVNRRFFEEWKGGIPHDLCYAFNNHLATFPSRESAIDAAEIFSAGQHWEVAPLVWVNREGEWRFGGPNLIL
jgi:hypothetical protein